MTVELARLSRQARSLEEAEGLLGELKAQAISRGDYDQQMVMLETSNPDLDVITDARMDPHGEGHRVSDELAKVREQIEDLNKGDAP